MHVFCICQVLCSSKRHTRSCNTLNRRIICKVNKEHRTLDSTTSGEVIDKKLRFLKRNSHSSKHDRKINLTFARLPTTRRRYTCLPGNLGRKLRMRKSRSGKDRELLSKNKRIHSIDG